MPRIVITQGDRNISTFVYCKGYILDENIMPSNRIGRNKHNSILNDCESIEYTEVAIRHKVTFLEIYKILKNEKSPSLEWKQLMNAANSRNKTNSSLSEIEIQKQERINKLNHDLTTTKIIEKILNTLSLDLFFLSNPDISQQESLDKFKENTVKVKSYLFTEIDEYGLLKNSPEQIAPLFDENGFERKIKRYDWFLHDYADKIFMDEFDNDRIRKNFSNAFVYVIYADILHTRKLTGHFTDDLLYTCKLYLLSLENRDDSHERIANKNNSNRSKKISCTKSKPNIIKKEKKKILMELIKNKILNLKPFEYKEINEEILTNSKKMENKKKEKKDDRYKVSKHISKNIYPEVMKHGLTMADADFNLSIEDGLTLFIEKAIKNNMEIRNIYNETRFPQ